jgi:hypothetical protein
MNGETKYPRRKFDSQKRNSNQQKEYNHQVEEMGDGKIE